MRSFKIIFKLILFFTLLVSHFLFAQRTNRTKQKEFDFPLTNNHWSSLSSNAEFINYKSVKAVRSTNDKPINIFLNDFEFSTGTIEFDVELNGRGFPGINFHIDKDTLNSEIFYIRYFGKPNKLLRTTLQYAAVIDSVNLWDVSDEYQAAALIKENDWNHVKLVISENQMKAYVNDMEKPALHVPILEGVTKDGGISLSGDVTYANMVIKPDYVENLSSEKGYDRASYDPNYLKSWKILKPINFPTGFSFMKQINRSPGMEINSKYYEKAKGWENINAGPRGFVNITKKYGKTPRDKRRLTWLKTRVISSSDQLKTMNIGFSDEVWVVINGQPLYQDEIYFGAPGMKQPRGRCSLDNATIQIPLKSGENEILIGVTNYFFGWGIVARWEEMDGISL